MQPRKQSAGAGRRSSSFRGGLGGGGRQTSPCAVSARLSLPDRLGSRNSQRRAPQGIQLLELRASQAGAAGKPGPEPAHASSGTVPRSGANGRVFRTPISTLPRGDGPPHCLASSSPAPTDPVRRGPGLGACEAAQFTQQQPQPELQAHQRRSVASHGLPLLQTDSGSASRPGAQ